MSSIPTLPPLNANKGNNSPGSPQPGSRGSDGATLFISPSPPSTTATRRFPLPSRDNLSSSSSPCRAGPMSARNNNNNINNNSTSPEERVSSSSGSRTARAPPSTPLGKIRAASNTAAKTASASPTHVNHNNLTAIKLAVIPKASSPSSASSSTASTAPLSDPPFTPPSPLDLNAALQQAVSIAQKLPDTQKLAFATQIRPLLDSLYTAVMMAPSKPLSPWLTNSTLQSPATATASLTPPPFVGAFRRGSSLKIATGGSGSDSSGSSNQQGRNVMFTSRVDAVGRNQVAVLGGGGGGGEGDSSAGSDGVSFDPFISRLALETHESASHNMGSSNVSLHMQAALLFIDISGYSAAVTALAPRGPFAISSVVNAYFERIIEIAARLKGQVIAFAGDAVTLAWPVSGRGNLDAATTRAAMCAVQLQKNAGEHKIEGLDNFFRIHIALAAGDVVSTVYYSQNARSATMAAAYHVLSGPAVVELADLVDLAESGETACSARVMQLLNNQRNRILKAAKEQQLASDRHASSGDLDGSSGLPTPTSGAAAAAGRATPAISTNAMTKLQDMRVVAHSLCSPEALNKKDEIDTSIWKLQDVVLVRRAAPANLHARNKTVSPSHGEHDFNSSVNKSNWSNSGSFFESGLLISDASSLSNTVRSMQNEAIEDDIETPASASDRNGEPSERKSAFGEEFGAQTDGESAGDDDDSGEDVSEDLDEDILADATERSAQQLFIPPPVLARLKSGVATKDIAELRFLTVMFVSCKVDRSFIQKNTRESAASRPASANNNNNGNNNNDNNRGRRSPIAEQDVAATAVVMTEESGEEKEQAQHEELNEVHESQHVFTCNWVSEVSIVLDKAGFTILQLLDNDKGLHIVACLGAFTADASSSRTGVIAARDLAQRLPGLCRIGVASGQCFIGCVGHNQLGCRFDITGAAVVRAARLMGEAQKQNIAALVDGDFACLLGDVSMLAPVGTVEKIKGSEGGTTIYSPTMFDSQLLDLLVAPPPGLMSVNKRTTLKIANFIARQLQRPPCCCSENQSTSLSTFSSFKKEAAAGTTGGGERTQPVKDQKQQQQQSYFVSTAIVYGAGSSGKMTSIITALTLYMAKASGYDDAMQMMNVAAMPAVCEFLGTYSIRKVVLNCLDSGASTVAPAGTSLHLGLALALAVQSWNLDQATNHLAEVIVSGVAQQHVLRTQSTCLSLMISLIVKHKLRVAFLIRNAPSLDSSSWALIKMAAHLLDGQIHNNTNSGAAKPELQQPQQQQRERQRQSKQLGHIFFFATVTPTLSATTPTWRQLAQRIPRRSLVTASTAEGGLTADEIGALVENVIGFPAMKSFIPLIQEKSGGNVACCVTLLQLIRDRRDSFSNVWVKLDKKGCFLSANCAAVFDRVSWRFVAPAFCARAQTSVDALARAGKSSHLQHLLRIIAEGTSHRLFGVSQNTIVEIACEKKRVSRTLESSAQVVADLAVLQQLHLVTCLEKRQYKIATPVLLDVLLDVPPALRQEIARGMVTFFEPTISCGVYDMLTKSWFLARSGDVQRAIECAHVAKERWSALVAEVGEEAVRSSSESSMSVIINRYARMMKKLKAEITAAAAATTTTAPCKLNDVSFLDDFGRMLMGITEFDQKMVQKTLLPLAHWRPPLAIGVASIKLKEIANKLSACAFHGARPSSPEDAIRINVLRMDLVFVLHAFKAIIFDIVPAALMGMEQRNQLAEEVLKPLAKVVAEILQRIGLAPSPTVAAAAAAAEGPFPLFPPPSSTVTDNSPTASEITSTVAMTRSPRSMIVVEGENGCCNNNIPDIRSRQESELFSTGECVLAAAEKEETLECCRNFWVSISLEFLGFLQSDALTNFVHVVEQAVAGKNSLCGLPRQPKKPVLASHEVRTVMRAAYGGVVGARHMTVAEILSQQHLGVGNSLAEAVNNNHSSSVASSPDAVDERLAEKFMILQGLLELAKLDLGVLSPEASSAVFAALLLRRREETVEAFASCLFIGLSMSEPEVSDAMEILQKYQSF